MKEKPKKNEEILLNASQESKSGKKGEREGSIDRLGFAKRMVDQSEVISVCYSIHNMYIVHCTVTNAKCLFQFNGIKKISRCAVLWCAVMNAHKATNTGDT